MAGKTLSSAETIAQLTRRPAANTPRRRTLGADAAGAADARLVRHRDDAVWRHKFRVGQTVMLAPNRYGGNRLSGFKVVSLLPQEHGVNQYRLKSTADGHERVATENELN